MEKPTSEKLYDEHKKASEGLGIARKTYRNNLKEANEVGDVNKHPELYDEASKDYQEYAKTKIKELMDSNDLAQAKIILSQLEMHTNPPKEIRDFPEGECLEYLGKDNFFGSKDIEKAFGFKISENEIPLCPYTNIELQQIKERDEMLILRVETDGNGKPLTMERIHELAKNGISDKLLYDIDWYKNEPFFKEEKIQARWVRVTKECINNSLNKDYIEQTRILRDSLKKVNALTDEEIEACSDKNLDKIREFMNENYDKNWKKAAEQLAELAVNKNHRRTVTEAFYDFILRFKNTAERSLFYTYDWTNTRASDGGLVGFGGTDSKGASVAGIEPGRSGSDLGVVASR